MTQNEFKQWKNDRKAIEIKKKKLFNVAMQKNNKLCIEEEV